MPNDDGGERYQVRGVPKDLQDRVAEVARVRKTTVRVIVTEALEAYLASPAGGPQPIRRAKPLDNLGRLEAVTADLAGVTGQVKALAQLLERRLDQMDRRATQPQSTNGLPLFD